MSQVVKFLDKLFGKEKEDIEAPVYLTQVVSNQNQDNGQQGYYYDQPNNPSHQILPGQNPNLPLQSNYYTGRYQQMDYNKTNHNYHQYPPMNTAPNIRPPPQNIPSYYDSSMQVNNQFSQQRNFQPPFQAAPQNAIPPPRHNVGLPYNSQVHPHYQNIQTYNNVTIHNTQPAHAPLIHQTNQNLQYIPPPYVSNQDVQQSNSFNLQDNYVQTKVYKETIPQNKTNPPATPVSVNQTKQIVVQKSCDFFKPDPPKENVETVSISKRMASLNVSTSVATKSTSSSQLPSYFVPKTLTTNNDSVNTEHVKPLVYQDNSSSLDMRNTNKAAGQTAPPISDCTPSANELTPNQNGITFTNNQEYSLTGSNIHTSLNQRHHSTPSSQGYHSTSSQGYISTTNEEYSLPSSKRNNSKSNKHLVTSTTSQNIISREVSSVSQMHGNTSILENTTNTESIPVAQSANSFQQNQNLMKTQFNSDSERHPPQKQINNNQIRQIASQPLQMNSNNHPVTKGRNNRISPNTMNPTPVRGANEGGPRPRPIPTNGPTTMVPLSFRPPASQLPRPTSSNSSHVITMNDVEEFSPSPPIDIPRFDHNGQAYDRALTLEQRMYIKEQDMNERRRRRARAPLNY